MAKKITYAGLRRFNLIMAGLHFLQALIVFLIADPTKGLQPVTASYLTLKPGTEQNPVLISASSNLFNINLATIVIVFFLLSSAAHLFIATIYRKKYESGLKKGLNQVRWYEYSLSASTMLVGIALLTGIYNIGALVMIFALTAIMNLMGLVMELYNQGREKISWMPYYIGCLAGIIPWIAIGMMFWAGNKFGVGHPPTFVYAIYVSLFLFFNCFAINMVLQYKKVGKWNNYLYGERAYIILSLLAKSALAWQVFAGTLRP